MWKETADEKEFIADLKKDVYHYKAQSSRLQREFDSEKRKLQEVDKIWEERWTEFNQSRYSELRQAEEINDILRKELTDVKKENERLKGKVKEEAQKLFDKERKEKKKAKKAIKKAKKLAALSDSDSSDSD
jgi:hypothetical protein